MDPLSISVACLAVISATIKSSRALVTVFHDLNHNSEDIKQILRAVETFQPVLDSLAASLKEVDQRTLTLGSLAALGGVINPLEACNTALQQLLAKLNPRPEIRSRKQRIITRIKWVTLTKREVAELCSLLDSLKATLQITLLQLAISKLFAPRDNSISAISKRDGYLPITDKTPDSDEWSLSDQGVSASKGSTVPESQHMILTEVPPQSLAISSMHRELQNLTSSIENVRFTGSCGDGGLQSASATPDEIFFDCISQCSENDTEQVIDDISKSYSGSASYFFERGSSFFPEQYSCDLIFKDELTFVASAWSRTLPDTQEYFLYYAKNPREWHRVHAYLSLPTGMECCANEGGLRSLEESWGHCNLRPWLQEMLLLALSDIVLVNSVTSLYLPTFLSTTKLLQCDTANVRVQEDFYETVLANESAALDRLRLANCKFFLEQTLTTLRRGYSNMFYVRDGTQEYIEHKARFVHAGQQNENGFQSFLTNLWEAMEVSKCDGVAKFVGAVLDSTGSHIRGYLCESVLYELRFVLNDLESRDVFIPRNLRRHWAYQLIHAVRDVHKAGLIVGKFLAGIDSELNLKLYRTWSVPRFIYDKAGNMPPELRNTGTTAFTAQRFTRETDIFQLGTVLWCLSEHRRESVRTLCKLNNCTSRNYAQCTAEHTNPVALPTSDRADELFKDIISSCRLREPEKRPTAQEIVEAFQWQADPAGITNDKTFFRQQYQTRQRLFMRSRWCNECGKYCSDEYYHCKVCSHDDFDLCKACIAAGIYCWDRSHILAHLQMDQAGKKTWKDNHRWTGDIGSKQS